MSFIKNLSFFVLLIFFSVLFSVYAFADEHVSVSSGMDLTVSPTYFNLLLEPGETKTVFLKVRNNSSNNELLEFNLFKFAVNNNSYESTFIEEVSSEDEFLSWVTFPKSEIVLAGQTSTIKLLFNIPENAKFGYYYAIGIKKSSNVFDNAVINGTAAVPLLVYVGKGSAIKELELVELKTSKYFYEYLPAEFDLTVKNNGNIHIAPFGDLYIDSFFKKDISRLDLNEGKSNVLPGTQRVYKVLWDDAFLVLKDDKLKVNWDKLNKFRIGKYTAHALFIYNNGERDVPLSLTYSFWVFPWKVILVLTIIFGLQLYGLIILIKRFFKRIFRSKKK